MFEIERTIGSSHLGDGGRISIGTIVDFMQDCCGFQMDQSKELTEYFTANRITMFLVSRQLNIHKMPRYGDRIFIRTFIYELKAAYGFRNTLIYDKAEQLLVSSYATGAYIDIANARMTTLPEEVRNMVPMKPKFAGMEYLPRKVKIPEGEICGEMPVYQHYIDENHHVNNARYFDFAEEWLPTDFQTKIARIEYKTAAKAGDIIVPARYCTEDAVFISLAGKAGEVYANVEFQR